MGTWCAEKGVELRVLHSSIAAAHIFRVASADAAKHEVVKKTLDAAGAQPGKIHGKPSFVNHNVRQALASFLMSFTQGLHILVKGTSSTGWVLTLSTEVSLTSY